jgi:hypothetical protein
MVDFVSRAQQGLQAGRDFRVNSLQSSLAEQMRQPGFSLGQSADFNTLTAIAPQLAQQQVATFSQISGQRRDKYIKTMMNAKAALEMGNTEGALNYFDQQIGDVVKQGGDPSNTQYVRQLATQDPAAALEGLKRMEATLAQQGVLELSPQDKKRAERRVQSTKYVDGGSYIQYSDGSQEFRRATEDEIRAIKNYQWKFPVDLSSGEKLEVISRQNQAAESRKMANNAQAMAEKYRDSDPSSGVFAKGSELWKSVWGTENEVSSMRKDYTKMVNSFIINQLPTGVASDRDVALIKDGYLPATANKDQIISFLGAMSRLQQDIAMQEEFRAAFLERSGGIQAANRPFEYNGVQFNEGDTLEDAYRTYINKKFPNQGRREGNDDTANDDPLGLF